ncbi:MAG: VWA domain-containing protein [Phycisphaerae bacterium]|nr:VWA domain-containing protein [Phycisphaerae bacterium]
MTLLHPIWLMLLIPAAAAMLLWRMPSRLLTVMRAIVLALLVAAACAPAINLPSRAGTVVVVADRSRSMPPESDAAQKEAINLIQSKMSAKDRLAVVAFGARAAIERPAQGGKFGDFVSRVGPDASDLAGAIELGVSLIPTGSPGRVLLLTDGRWTGKDPLAAASQAASRDIAVDYRPLQRPVANDVAISRIEAPPAVTPGEAFMITAWVRSPIKQKVSYELARGGTVLSAAARDMPSGLSRLTFRDQAGKPGTRAYLLRIATEADDPVKENNRARILVGVHGPKPMLCVTDMKDPSGLVGLLRAGRPLGPHAGMNIAAKAAADCRWDLEDLSEYSSVLIEDVPAEDIGSAGMETLAAWVSETGSGMMMTGGKNAYAPGGYFKSPLERIMPVSMELRREHRKLALAIVVALDRSGSMAMSAGGGKTKMDLANLGAAEVVKLLSPLDEIGVVAVDSSPHVIVNLTPVTDPQGIRRKILSIDSMGGGIFVYEALVSASKMLTRAQAQTRHIILFADAADSEHPHKYKPLLAAARKAGVTCSVIGLGTKRDRDAGLLQDVANCGGGRCYFTNKATELPRLFAQDTFVIARSTFIDDPTAIRTTGALAVLTGRQFPKPPLIGGYNLCYLRPGAAVGALTVDEYKAPVIVSWQAGIGRVVCYTGQADGDYTGRPMKRWKEVGSLFSSLARWTAGEVANLPDNMLLTQKVVGGLCELRLHLDPEKKQLPFASLPKVTTLRGLPGAKPTSAKASMEWLDPETLGLDVPLAGSETAISTVEVPGAPVVSLPPVCLAYSPEFRPVEPGKGSSALARIADATGGTERVDLPAIWQVLPRMPRQVQIGHWLLLAAAIILIIEVFERRTGLVSVGSLRRLRATAEEEPEQEAAPAVAARKKPRLSWFARRRADKPPAPAAPTPAAPAEEPAEDKKPTDMFDAFKTARRRAKGRTKRKK